LRRSDTGVNAETIALTTELVEPPMERGTGQGARVLTAVDRCVKNGFVVTWLSITNLYFGWLANAATLSLRL